MYKYELARAAGVSTRTFNRWLNKQKAIFDNMGISKKQRLLPPKAVEYICREYGINPEDF